MDTFKCKIVDEVLLIQEEKCSHFHIWIVPIHDWMTKIGIDARNLDKIIGYSKRIYNDETKRYLLECTEKLKDLFKM